MTAPAPTVIPINPLTKSTNNLIPQKGKHVAYLYKTKCYIFLKMLQSSSKEFISSALQLDGFVNITVPCCLKHPTGKRNKSQAHAWDFCYCELSTRCLFTL